MLPAARFVWPCRNSEVDDVAEHDALELDVVVEVGAVRDAGSAYANRTGEEVDAALVWSCHMYSANTV